jgi:hypothetical protein
MSVHAIRLVSLLIVALPALPVYADNHVLAAIRTAKSVEVKRLLQSPADANSRDETGATALMYAAIYATTPVMQLLLDGGADVNAANAHGSTALMWAAGDAAKVRLLLDRGASVNAKSSDEVTALLVAARYRNADSVRLLLAHGADPKAPSQTELARAVFMPENDLVRELMAKSGFSWVEGVQSGVPLIFPNITNHAAVEQLLAAGASPKEKLVPPTMTAISRRCWFRAWSTASWGLRRKGSSPTQSLMRSRSRWRRSNTATDAGAADWIRGRRSVGSLPC